MSPPGDRDVALWMLERLEKSGGLLYQEEAAWIILQSFGQSFVYENENGNWAISRKVLAEFRKLTEDTVVWERGERCWRRRQSYDTPGRRLSD